MDITELLSMKTTEIAQGYGSRNPILEEGGDNRLPSTILITKTFRPGTTLQGIIQFLSKPQKWCIYDYPNPSEWADPRLLVAVVDDLIIPKGQLRVKDIRYAFGGCVDYQKVVDTFNKI